MDNSIVDIEKVCNDLSQISKYFIDGQDRIGFLALGVLIENLRNRVRNDNDTSKDKEASESA